jgi:hypothetical protein
MERDSKKILSLCGSFEKVLQAAHCPSRNRTDSLDTPLLSRYERFLVGAEIEPATIEFGNSMGLIGNLFAAFREQQIQ